jgi:predicted O-methyltransferase YrrM
MKMLGLFEVINLLYMPNDEAIKKLSDIQIRFLFIDGDHTKEGVSKDIQLFFPKMVPGSIVVFDDFSKEFPGLIEAVDHLLNEKKFSRIMSYHRTLVLQI